MSFLLKSKNKRQSSGKNLLNGTSTIPASAATTATTTTTINTTNLTNNHHNAQQQQQYISSPTGESQLYNSHSGSFCRILRTKDDLTPDSATQLIQRYWHLCKNRKILSKQYHQRRNIIAETIKTEETYVTDLKTIVEVFHKPIQKKEMIPAKQLNTIFGNISMIYNLNQTFLNRLHDIQKNELKKAEEQKLSIDRQLGLLEQQQQLEFQSRLSIDHSSSPNQHHQHSLLDVNSNSLSPHNYNTPRELLSHSANNNNNGNNHSQNNNNHGSSNNVSHHQQQASISKHSSTNSFSSAAQLFKSEATNAAQLLKNEAIKTVDRVKIKADHKKIERASKKLNKRLSFKDKSAGAAISDNDSNNSNSPSSNINNNINNSVKDKNRFGAAFKETVPFMKLYTVYINNYTEVIELLRELRKSNSQLDAYLKECKKRRPECRGMDIASFMILPVQRIPRYQLLLRELLKNTPTSYPDFKLLDESHTEIVKVANHLNSMKKKKDGLTKTIDIQKRIGNLIDDYKSLMLGDGVSEKDVQFSTVMNRLNMYKSSLIQPNRHYVDEAKVELKRGLDSPSNSSKQSSVSIMSSSDDDDFQSGWKEYDAFLYTDLFMLIIETGSSNNSSTDIDESDESTTTTSISNSRTCEENLRADVLVQSLFLCFSELEQYYQDNSRGHVNDNVLVINYMVGGHNYYIRFKDSDTFSKFSMLLNNQINEEKDKLKNTFVDKLVEDDEDEGDINHAEKAAVKTLRELKTTIKKKQNVLNLMNKGKEDFGLIRNKFDQVKTEYDLLRRRLQETRSQPEEYQINSQKDILIVEKKIAEVEAVVNECIDRLKLGIETLTRYTENMKEIDHILLTCLRGDMVAFQSIFETIDVFKDMDMDTIKHQIKVYELKIKQRQDNKMSSKITPIGKTSLSPPSSARGSPRSTDANTSGEQLPSTNTLSPSESSSMSGPTAINTEVMNQIFLLQQEKKALQDKVIDLEKQVHQKKVLFDNSCKERRKLTQELEEISKKFQMVQEEQGVPTRARSSSTAQAPSDENVVLLQNRISELEGTVDTLTKRNNELTVQMGQLKTDLRKSQSDIISPTTTDSIADNSTTTNSVEVTDLHGNIRELNRTILTLSQQNSELKERYDILNQSHKELNQKAVELTQENSRLLSDNKILSSESKSKHDLTNELTTSKSKLEAQVEDLKVDVEKHRTQLKSMRKKLKRTSSIGGNTPRGLDPLEDMKVNVAKSQEYVKLELRVAELESQLESQTDYQRKFEEMQTQLLREQRRQTQIESDYEDKIRNLERQVHRLKMSRIDREIYTKVASPSKVDASHASIAQKILMFNKTNDNLNLGPSTSNALVNGAPSTPRRVSGGSSIVTPAPSQPSSNPQELDAMQIVTRRVEHLERVLSQIASLTHDSLTL